MSTSTGKYSCTTKVAKDMAVKRPGPSAGNVKLGADASSSSPCSEKGGNPDGSKKSI